MKLFGLGVIALASLLPEPAHAQAVKLADLVGAWIPTDSMARTKDTVIIRSDSTSNWGNGIEVAKEFHPIARLSGDTVRFWPQGRIFIITLKDDQLTLKDALTLKDHQLIVYRYTRVPTPKSKP